MVRNVAARGMTILSLAFARQLLSKGAFIAENVAPYKSGEVKNVNYPYARRMSELRASEIRELLKLTEQPHIISFAGGLPAPELFPVEEIIEASVSVLREDGRAALQYTTTEGYAPLRAWIADRLNKTRGTAFDADNILITSGSQQALDLTGKVFLDEGDTVLCECPTYLAAISAFRAYGCRFQEVPTDDDGMIPEALEGTSENDRAGQNYLCDPGFSESNRAHLEPGTAATPGRAGRTVRGRRHRG